MKLVRLTYASLLSKKCGPEALSKILEASRRNNHRLGVTGALCYSPRGFLQILEGPADAVNTLYHRIVGDARHSAVTLLEYGPIASRDFENWSMAYVRAEDITESLLRKFTTRDRFDPFEMSPAQARGFLMAVAQERAEFLARQQEAVRKLKKA